MPIRPPLAPRYYPPVSDPLDPYLPEEPEEPEGFAPLAPLAAPPPAPRRKRWFDEHPLTSPFGDPDLIYDPVQGKNLRTKPSDHDDYGTPEDIDITPLNETPGS